MITQQRTMRIREVPLKLIDPPSFSLRDIDGATITDLRISIEKYGVLQPILVNFNSTSKRYTIVFGNHRFYATKGAGLKTIPAIITEVTNREALLLSVTENVVRLQLNPLREGEVYLKLTGGYTDKTTLKILSSEIGKSVTYIKERIRLFQKLHPDLKNEIGKTLTLTNAIHLSKFGHVKQKFVFEEIKKKRKELTVNSGGGFGFGGNIVYKPSPYCVCPKCGSKHLRGVSVGNK